MAHLKAQLRDQDFDCQWDLPPGWVHLKAKEVDAILRHDRRSKRVRTLVMRNRRKRLGRGYAQKSRQRAKERVQALETLVQELKPNWDGFDVYVDSATKG